MSDTQALVLQQVSDLTTQHLPPKVKDLADEIVAMLDSAKNPTELIQILQAAKHVVQQQFDHDLILMIILTHAALELRDKKDKQQVIADLAKWTEHLGPISKILERPDLHTLLGYQKPMGSASGFGSVFSGLGQMARGFGQLGSQFGGMGSALAGAGRGLGQMGSGLGGALSAFSNAISAITKFF